MNKGDFIMNQVNVNERLKAEEACIQEFLSKTMTLNEALKATLKQVNVKISADDLRALKDSGYRMCFAKKVGSESYNVVWQSYKEFSENNKFSWTPQYQAFRTDTFMAGVKVETSSDPVNIGLGEVTTIDEYGILSDPVTGGDTTAINVNNQYQATHLGVCQLSTGIDGKTISTPIYVSENQCMLGSAKLKPIEKVLVWFEQEAETGTMFTDMKSTAIEVNLTQKNEVNIKYEHEKWSIV